MSKRKSQLWGRLSSQRRQGWADKRVCIIPHVVLYLISPPSRKSKAQRRAERVRSEQGWQYINSSIVPMDLLAYLGLRLVLRHALSYG